MKTVYSIMAEARKRDRVRARLPELQVLLSPEDWEWSPIGDNTLAAFNFAAQIEREEGIERNVTLALVRDEVVPASAK